MKKFLALVIMTIITFSQLSAFAMAESAECACVINALSLIHIWRCRRS